MKHKFLLVFTMVCLLCSKTWAQTATQPSGSGSSDDPFEITSVDNLYWLTQNSDYWSGGYYFEQTADIDASGISSFTPIGNLTTNFTGTYDGQGYSISNLTINSNDGYVGFFGKTNEATIKNIGLVDCSITSTSMKVGSLAGMEASSIISNCYSTGSVSGQYYVGGLIGSTSVGTIQKCYSKCSVTAETTCAGGLVGNSQSACKISNCYSTGAVSGSNYLGGIVGQLWGGNEGLNYCYTTSSISSTSTTYTGAVVGYTNCTFTNCYYNSDNNSDLNGVGTDAKGNAATTGLTKTEMKTLSSFSGWDFAGLTTDGDDDIWAIASASNNGYPILEWQIDETSATEVGTTSYTSSSILSCSITSLGVPNPVEYGFCYSTSVESPTIGTDGCDTTCIGAVNGTETAPISFTDSIDDIESGTTYYACAYATNANGTVYSDVISFEYEPEGGGTEDDPYLITSLTDLQWLSDNSDAWSSYFKQTADIDASGISSFTPIGTSSSSSFSGSYNGNGHIIDNLTISRTKNNTGLFGYSTGTIEKLGITNCKISGGGSYVGALVGYQTGTVSKCYSTGSVSSSGTIECGGLAGDNYGGTIEYCYSTATVSASSARRVGGLVGNNCNGTVEYCYSVGSVSGKGNVGGLVGYYTAANSSYYNSETSGQSDTKASSLTTEEMKTISSFSGWDFYEDSEDGEWAISSDYNDGYPILSWQIDEVTSPEIGDVSVYIDADDNNTATLDCNFESLGLPNPVAYGFCIVRSKNDDPTIDSTYVDLGDVSGAEDADDVSFTFSYDPTSTVDSFSDDDYHIFNGETYHINAYATNASGTVYCDYTTFTYGTTPTITWSQGSEITYRTALSVATASDNGSEIDGTFTYSLDEGTTVDEGAVLDAGDYTVTLTFVPTDADTYNSVTKTVTLTVDKADPTISWDTPDDISYGTALSDTQLNATADVNGTFTYSLDAGTVLDAGEDQTLSVTFTPDDTENYNSASASVSINVSKADPTISWNTPDDISYGTALSETQLNASADVDGTFTYSLDAGTVLDAGDDQTLSVTFTPDDAENYNSASAFVSINVSKADPTISWDTPDDISYGTALSDTQLNASADVDGTFTYSQEAGTVLDAGNDQTLSVTFTPDDTDNYNSVNASVTISVTQDSQSITFDAIAAKTYGDEEFDLAATASSGLDVTYSSSNTSVATISGSSVTIVGAGEATITAAQSGSDNYSEATSVTQTLTVAKADPTISWDNPDDISYGTALSDTQLNASADVDGTFTYSQVAGTVLDAGDDQTLSVTFTPDDTDNYNSANASVTISVTQAGQSITFDAIAAKTYGDEEFDLAATASSGLDVTYSSSNTSVATISGSTVTIVSAGEATIIAAQSGNDNYSAATSVTQTLTVDKADPTISWGNPSDITYGTALSDTQLDATADVDGTFTYSQEAGTVLNAGDDQTLSVTFTPDDAENYNSASASVSINVNKANPTISWDTPSDISYGTALSDTQLNATADVDGTFTYSLDAGTVLDAGDDQTLSVTFTPDDAENYNSASTSVSINVNKANPAISWDTPSDISYGTALSDTQLNATADVDGTFTYSQEAGTVLDAGDDQTLNVTFTPDDAENYNSASASVSINVNKADPAISWDTPDDISYGTALSETQLNASADVDGTFTYSQEAGTVLEAGDNQNLSVTFTPDDTENYNSASASVSINVSKADPTISWDTPDDISYGTALSDTQLNATADMDGTFTYSQETGTVLEAGDNQTLSVTFTPDNTDNYNSASASVAINVSKADPTISWDTPSAITYGTALSDTQLNATADVDGTFTYSQEAGTVFDAGDDQTLSVTFTPDDTENYNSAEQAVNIAVNKATLTVTADNQSMVQGEELPDFTVSYSGFVNDEDESDLVTLPSATTTATSESDAGEYAITVSGGSDTNYDFTYVSGTLTIEVATGISDVTEDVLRVYPNPASDIIYIDGAEGMVTLYNISGKKVLTHDLSNNNSIEISNLDEGIYILNVDGKNVKIIKR